MNANLKSVISKVGRKWDFHRKKFSQLIFGAYYYIENRCSGVEDFLVLISQHSVQVSVVEGKIENIILIITST